MRAVEVQGATGPADDYLCLPYRLSLSDFIDYMRRMAVEGYKLSEQTLTDTWRASVKHFVELQQAEAGHADNFSLQQIPLSMQSRVRAVSDDPAVKRHLQPFQHEWAMVELDKLVVFQDYVDLSYVQGLKSALPSIPGDQDVLTFSLGLELQRPPIRCVRVSDTTFQFASVSRDLHSLEVALLEASDIPEHVPPGHAASVIAVVVGYGLNLISAVRCHNRLLLSNGTHRAFALRERGITHVPCLIRHVDNEQEFAQFKVPEIHRNFALYFKAPRPPLFKDYFDESLWTLMRVPRGQRLVTVQLTIQNSRLLL